MNSLMLDSLLVLFEGHSGVWSYSEQLHKIWMEGHQDFQLEFLFNSHLRVILAALMVKGSKINSNIYHWQTHHYHLAQLQLNAVIPFHDFQHIPFEIVLVLIFVFYWTTR